MEKPKSCQEKHLEFLDKLRESGATNMFSAALWLEDAYDELSKDESQKILTYWMQTFTDRHKTKST